MITNNANVKLSAPWITFYRQIEALFKKDPSIKTDFDEDDMVIRIYVESQDKAYALAQLLPNQRIFGNVPVTISVILANQPTKKVELLEKAFEGNPIFSYASTIEGISSNPISYVVFDPVVAQFWNDNLHDPHGLVSTLYENLAREIFGESEGICFTTDSEEPVAVG